MAARRRREAPPGSSVADYANAVVAGGIPAGVLVGKACERHLADLEHGSDRGLVFDGAAAQHAIDFFGFLKHYKGEWAGQPFTLRPWQAFIIGSMFGWKRADGTRRFRDAYVEVPRKNGKSTLAGGAALYLEVADGEPGAEVYSAATKRDQARIVFNTAQEMVAATPALRRRIRVFRNRLVVPATRSKFEPLGADVDTLDGLDVHGAIIDELHAHKTRAAVDILDTATGARRQPLSLKITTAGSDRTSVCWEEHDYAVKVIEGLIDDDETFAFIATIDEGDDWADEAAWQKANPNYGVSVKPDDLRRKCAKAQKMVSAQNAFRRRHLDEWTEQVDRWVDLAVWDQGGTEFDPAPLVGRECIGGLDLSTKLDISAFQLVFPPEDGSLIWHVISHFFVPEENVQKRQRKDRVPYDAWVKAGLMEATPGDIIDYDVIRRRINQQAELYVIREIAFDSWNAAQIGTQLMTDGFRMVEIRQGTRSMGGPSKDFEALVVARRLNHGNNPALRLMMANTAIRKDANDNYMPDKAKSNGRIDGIVATIMALGRAMVIENAAPDLNETIKRRGGLIQVG